MSEVTPEQILAINPSIITPIKKETAVGWIILWLLLFTPVGIWLVIKSSWPVWIKGTVCVATGLVFVVLLIESVVLPYQLATSILPQ